MTLPENYPTREQLVKNGIAFLDEHFPDVDWWNQIDTDHIVMAEGSRCVLGQLGIKLGHYNADNLSSSYSHMLRQLHLTSRDAWRYGFQVNLELGFHERPHDYGDLEVEWAEQLQELQHTRAGKVPVKVLIHELLELDMDRVVDFDFRQLA